MYNVALIGHSLLPTDFFALPDVAVSVFRRPGGTWLDSDCSEYGEFWCNNYDLAIIVLGGNDLAFVDHLTAIQRAKEFVNRIKGRVGQIRVYTVEPRDYTVNNRFGISTLEFLRRRRKYNRVLKRWLKADGHRHIDIGKPWIVNERTRDGVHFNQEAIRNFKRSISKVILGVKGAQ